jgi:hypothetical protein
VYWCVLWVIHECDIFIFLRFYISAFWHFGILALFIAISVAFVFKVVVVQRFRGAAGLVFENGAVSVSRHARFGGVHFGPNAARCGRARVLAQLTARGFQLGGFA